MKKRFICLAGIALCAIALSSCSEDDKLSTAKDFDIQTLEVDSKAKLLTEDEKNKFCEEYQILSPSKDDVASFLKDYSTMVSVYKKVTEDYSFYQKLIVFLVSSFMLSSIVLSNYGSICMPLRL